MTAHLLHRKHLTKNRRAFSAVIATIFMVLAVLFLYFNVFMFMQNQDVKFQDTIIQSQQLDADRINEHILLIPNGSPSIGASAVSIDVTVTNDGSLPVKIIRAWLIDTLTGNVVHSDRLTFVLAAGNSLSSLTLDFQIANPSGPFRLEMVTSRGNVISISLV